MSKSRVLPFVLVACVLVASLLASPSTAEGPMLQDQVLRPIHRVVGSWFGRAIPIEPFCPPGTPECPVPPEVIMNPTFFADGVMMGSDSLTFGALHTTAHGDWRVVAPRSIEATMMWLQGSPEGAFVGGFRSRYIGELVGRDRMEGYVNIFFFPFVDDTGAAVLDPETGFPIPDPLTPLGDFITDPAQCNPAVGCLAVLEFVVRRVSVRLDD